MQRDAWLREVPLFRDVSPEDLSAVMRLLGSKRFEAGEVILVEQEFNRHLYVIVEGRVKITRKIDEFEVMLSELHERQTFGEMSVIDDSAATATATAITATHVLSMKRSDLEALLDTHPVAAIRIWQALAIDLKRRLAHTNDVVLNYFEINRALIDDPKFRELYALYYR